MNTRELWAALVGRLGLMHRGTTRDAAGNERRAVDPCNRMRVRGSMCLVIGFVSVFALLSCTDRNKNGEVAGPAAGPSEKLPDHGVERFLAVVSAAGESFEENIYLLWDTASRDGAIVDPGRASPELDALVSARGIRVRGILNTHGHFDHIGGNSHYRKMYHAVVYAHPGDKPFYEGDDLPTRFLADDEEIQMGSLKVRVLHTPGHSAGSVCFHVKGHLFSGDTLFAGTIGKADGERETRQLVSGIRSKLLTLARETVVYPGHGPLTTVGTEATGNPFLAEIQTDNGEPAGLDIKKVGDARVVTFKGEKLDARNVQIVRGQLLASAEPNGRQRLILNFSNVQFISEEGFGMLITLNRMTRRTNVRLRLCSLSPGIHEVFTILQLHKVFDIQKNVEDALNRPHDADADNRRLIWEQAMFRRIASEHDREIGHYNELVRLDPKDTEVYMARAVAFLRKGELDKAIADYTEAIRLNPELAQAYLSRGVAYQKKGEPDAAIGDLTKAIALRPDLVHSYRNRGTAYCIKGDYDAAIRDLTKAIELDPNDAAAYGERGVAFKEKEQYDAAVADYTKAIEMEPRQAHRYQNRAVAYYHLKAYDKAWGDVKKCRDLGFTPSAELIEDLTKASGRTE